MMKKNKEEGFKLITPDKISQNFKTDGLWFEDNKLFGIIDLKECNEKEIKRYNNIVRALNSFLIFIIIEIYLISYILLFLKTIIFIPFDILKEMWNLRPKLKRGKK